MKLKTQKLVLVAIAAAASLLFTCSPFAAGNYEQSDGDRIVYTDVEYSQDGRSITVYLDGPVPVHSSRALNLKNAIIGHDLFEIAFYDTVSGKIARAAWEKGHAAGVSGVARNVDYRYATVPDALGNNAGAAIIFVGKKSDRTLLGVGKLTGTDDSSVSGSTTLITANTKSVTFSVAAFVAGTGFTHAESSFWTAAKEGGGTGTNLTDIYDGRYTDIVSVLIGSQRFPLFRLNEHLVPGQTINAQYTIGVVSGEIFNDYKAGIRLHSPASLAILSSDYHLDPRYPRGNGLHEKSDILEKEDTGIHATGITITNNLSANAEFENTVQFRFATDIYNSGKIFAFSFQVPVYPLTNDDLRGTNGYPWYIRPGYDSYWYDLDDGRHGSGGAILIGTGDLGEGLNYNLWVSQPPEKRIYSLGDGYSFNLNGIEICIRAGSGELYWIKETILQIIPPDDPIVPNAIEFWLGERGTGQRIYKNDLLDQYLFDDYPANTVPSSYVRAQGMIDIKVYYYDSETQEPGADPYETMFTVYLNTSDYIPGNDNIPDTHRFIIASTTDFQEFTNRKDTEPGNYILVFYDSFDLQQILFNSAQYFFIIVAAKPDVVLGRAASTNGNGVFTVSNNASAGSSIYLGVWPFNSTLIVKGQAIISHPLTINAGGSYLRRPGPPDDFPPDFPAPPAGGYFINTTVELDVIRGPGLVVENSTYFSNDSSY